MSAYSPPHTHVTSIDIFLLLFFIGSTQFGTARYHDDTPPAYSLFFFFSPLQFVCHHLRPSVLLTVCTRPSSSSSLIIRGEIYIPSRERENREIHFFWTTGVVDSPASIPFLSFSFLYTHTQVTHVGGWLAGLVNTDLEKKRRKTFYIFLLLLFSLFLS